MNISLDLLEQDAFMMGEYITLAVKSKSVKLEDVDVMPDELQTYYYYIDQDQAKNMKAYKFTDETVGEVYWANVDGDIAILVNGTIYGSPFNKRDGIWMVCNGESVRFELEQLEKQHK